MVQPLDKKAKNRLLEIITEAPNEQVIRTWRGKHLLDREKYEMCMELEVPIIIEEQFFENWLDAGLYICKMQLDHYELHGRYQQYLIGQMIHYLLLKDLDEGNHEINKTKIETEIGRKWNISLSTAGRYSSLSEAINNIFTHSETFARKLLAGDLLISIGNIVEISRLKGDEIRAIEKAIEKDKVKKVNLTYIREEFKLFHIPVRGVVSRRQKKDVEDMQSAGIRKMPVYDPDAEVNSLCLTIESWISSIRRVKNSDNFTKISEKAGMQLMKKLSALEFVVNNVQETLVERTSL